MVDKLLPPDRRFRFEIAAGGTQALVDAVDAEVTAIGGTPTGAGTPAGGGDRPDQALKQGIQELRARFAARPFVEVGIGCESCHGGSRAHADDPRVLPDFAPRSSFLEARPEVARADGEVSRAERINRACARCHQVLFSRYPFTWEGGERRGPSPGGSSITSGEGRDFLLGGCARQMSCVTCHDPHGADRRADLDRLATPAGNGVCVRCHGQYAAPAALARHAHHDPNGAGASCVGCHMPRKNMGLGYALTRYHRIGLPDDPVRVERDRPIECALCHADKTVADLVSTMERWWGRRYDRAALKTLYGSLEARPLEATLARGKAHEQAVALATLGAAHAAQVTAGAAPRRRRPSAGEPLPAGALLRPAGAGGARRRRMRGRSRSPDGGDRRRRARLRPGGVSVGCARPSDVGRAARARERRSRRRLRRRLRRRRATIARRVRPRCRRQTAAGPAHRVLRARARPPS